VVQGVPGESNSAQQQGGPNSSPGMSAHLGYKDQLQLDNLLNSQYAQKLFVLDGFFLFL
jgi:hypothetical protein